MLHDRTKSMADIRKRTGKNGTSYQVRHPDRASASGYSYSTFSTLKEARDFRERIGAARQSAPHDTSIKTVPAAISRWLDICEKEGRDGKDPVTKYTHKSYTYRADIMRAYAWEKPLRALCPPDVIEFRSWLMKNYSRDLAKKVLSSFHSVVAEMSMRGHIASNVAAGISVRVDSRYDEPIVIPTPKEIGELLAAADRLADSKNLQIAKSWERYRPMLYLAVDSGMRPQEYLVLSRHNLVDGGAKVDRALERGDRKISVTKTPAGRRFIDLTPETFEMVKWYAKHKAVKNKHDLIFPTNSGQWQSLDNWRNRGFHAACYEAGLVIELEDETGAPLTKPKYKPYDLRHFYASMLIEQKINLKRIQQLMGHSDIKTTMNVYGHIIERVEDKAKEKFSLINSIRAS
jgi:integrase